MDRHIHPKRCSQSTGDPEDAISSTDDGSQPISQNVQDLANDIYKEFESLIKLYGNGFLHNLMPLVIRALENLDSLHSENSNLHLKALVLSDDHRLLSGEYEKEKKLRKVAENKLFHLEDDMEEERKQYEEKIATCDANVRILENKVKSLHEQISRFEEQETEMKREYQRLHDLYTNLLRAYLEYVERVRSMFNKNKLDNQCLSSNPYPSDNMCFEAGLPSLTSDRSVEADQLNQLGNTLNSESLETERQRIMRIIMETTPELYNSGRLFNNPTLSEPCFDELSQGDLPEDDGHDIKSHDGSCATPQPQPGEPLGVEFAGVRREVQNLIKENQELIQTKNALKIVTNDLIGRIDELSCQNFQFSSELNALITNRASMLLRIKDLEQENGQLRREFENSDLYGSLPGDEISENEDLPLSMRFRFSRVEMARVLLERNQYKEQLLELQEAVHLTHNLKVQQTSKLNDFNVNKRGRIKAFFARLFTLPQSQQTPGKLFTPSTFMNNSQSTNQYVANSASRLSTPSELASLSSSSQVTERDNGNTSVSVQKTISESCLNQDSVTWRSSIKQASISDLSNPTESSKMKQKRCTSPVQWFLHENEQTLDRENVKLAYVYRLDDYPSSCELRCATAIYPHHSTTLSSVSPPSINNLFTTTNIDNRLDSTNDTEVTTYSNADQFEPYEQQQTNIQSETEILRRSMNISSISSVGCNDSLGYSTVMDDHFSDIRSNIIWLSSFSMKHDLAAMKDSSSSLSSSSMFTGSDYPARIKSLITIVHVDYKSCQLLDSFAICSSTVLCMCSVPEASIKDLTCIENTNHYWEMLPMDTFSTDSEASQSLQEDILETKTKKSAMYDASCTVNECSITTGFKFLECDNTVNSNNNSLQRVDRIVDDSKQRTTSTPPTSHLSSIKHAYDHLSSTRRLVNALGIGSVSDVDEVTLSYVATRRRFLIRHIDCNSYNNGVHQTSKEMLDSHSSTTSINDDMESQYPCTSSTQHNECHYRPSRMHHSSSSTSCTSAQPTVWLGCQNGDLYVHSCVSDWRKCLHAIRLPDSITQICHLTGRVFVSLANGQIIVFRRHHHRINNNNSCISHSISGQSFKETTTVTSASLSSNLPDTNIITSSVRLNDLHISNVNLSSSDNDNNNTACGSWDFTEACVITCGRPQCSVKCTITVPPTNSVWAAYRNRILVINAFTLQLVDCFKVHAIQDAQVQTMSWYKDGVWISIKRESILRLYHIVSHELIQTVDLNHVIMNLLPNLDSADCMNISSKLKSCSLAVTVLRAMGDRLWIGTSVGLIITMHFQDTLFNRTFQQTLCERHKDSMNLSKRICKAILDCSSIQISTHQHTTPVRFFVTPTIMQQSEDNVNNQSNPVCQSTASMHKISDSCLLTKHKKGIDKPNSFMITGGEGHLIIPHKDDSKNNSHNEDTNDGSNRSHLIIWKL
ncbi:C-Jun-amino-terminal kinase-interacting protein 4 [Schistosoma japonicum]|nr:C-Jun-amino-terminal kinase-interacting protein 4 [Schistosoma japonicum]